MKKHAAWSAPAFLSLLLWILTAPLWAQEGKVNVIVGDFTGVTRHPAMAVAISQEVAHALSTHPQINTVPRSTWLNSNLIKGQSVYSGNAGSLNQSLNAQYSVSGSLQELDNVLEVTVLVFQGTTGANAGNRALSIPLQDLQSVPVKIAETVTQILKLPAHTFPPGAAQLGTLIDFGEGVKLSDQNKYGEAAKRFASANEKENNFSVSVAWQSEMAKNGLQTSQNAIERIEIYRMQGKSNEARQELVKAKAAGGNVTALKFAEAEILLQENKIADAEKILREIARTESKDPRVFYELAQVLRKAQKPEEAIEALKRAKLLDAKSIEISVALGEIQQLKGDFANAAHQFQEAGEMAYAEMNYELALRLFQRAKTIIPATAEILVQEGKTLLELGQIDAAYQSLTEATRLEPKNPLVAPYLGRIYFLRGETERAVKLLSAAVESNPQDFQTNYTLGLFYSKKSTDRKDQEAARKYLEIAVVLKADHKLAWLALARVYRSLEMFSKAQEAYSTAARLDRDDFFLANEAGEFCRTVGKFQDAELFFGQAIRLNPDYLDANENLGNVYKEQGKTQLAENQLAKVRRIDPTAGYSNSVLIKQIASLVQTLPNFVRLPEGVISFDHVALIDLRLRKTPVLTDWIKQQLRFAKPSAKAFVPVVQQALETRYTVQPYDEASKAAKAAGYNEETFRSPSQMKSLCQSLGVDAVVIARFDEDPSQEDVADKSTQRFRLKLTLFEKHSLGYFENGVNLLLPKQDFFAFNPIPVIAIALLLTGLVALVVWRITRGYGNVLVKIIYDKKDAAGYFALKLSKSANDSWATKFDKKTRFAKKTSFRKHNEEYMVGDVTQFKRFAIGDYHVHLFGNIAEKTDKNKIIGTQSTVKPVTVQKNKTSEVTFNLVNNEAYVEVIVHFNDKSVIGAEVTCKETGAKAVTQEELGAVLYLKLGDYHLTAVKDDLRATSKISIESLQAKEVVIHLHEAFRLAGQGKIEEAAQLLLDSGDEIEAAKMYEKAGQLVKACRILGEKFIREENYEKALACFEKCEDYNNMAAVYQRMGDMPKSYSCFGMAYLKKKQWDDAINMFTEGKDLENLAQAYAGKGDTANQYRVLGDHYRAKGQDLEAAGAYERGTQFEEAGAAYERTGNLIKAGEMYAKGNLFAKAAEAFSKGGDKTRAAMAFEKGGKLEEAAQLYDAIGDRTKAPKMLVEAGKYLDAARAYRGNGLLDEALGALRQVNPSDANFSAACDLMAEIFDEKGETSLALQAVQRGLQQIVIDSGNLDRFHALGKRQENSGDIYDAIRTYEKILSVNMDYKDLGHHVRQLKEKLQSQTMMGVSSHLGRTQAGGTPGAGAAPPAASSRYEIIREIGKGGMGVVYQAKDKLLERVVAFKLLPDEIKDNPQALEAFMKEAKASAKLSHPNLVTIFDTGQENGRSFISMEFVDGQTLKQLLHKVPQQLRLQDVLLVSLMIGDALSYAHRNQIIHRDVKPSNIMINKSKQVKIMDFGLATILQKASLEKTMMRGTPLYMAPEMILGRNVDYRSDIYSMGITMYEMATKRVPFSTGDVAYHHMHTPPPSPKQFNPNLPDIFCEIILRTIAKKQEERYQSMDELIRELKKMQASLQPAGMAAAANTQG